MKPIRTLLPLLAVFFSACGTPENEGETAEASNPAFTGGRVWNVGGMTVGTRSPTVAPISEEPMGPDASLAGPGPLEDALAASQAEPLPEGTAPTLDANIMPDGNPGETPNPVPQSPFDPALKNPPASNSPPPAGDLIAPPPAPAPQVPTPEVPAAGTPTPGA